MVKTQKLYFKNAQGKQLSAVLEQPLDSKPAHYAIFAHCFTCGKDFKAERNITLALSQNGYAVLRFDFTGLGQSEGDFADSNFTSNVEDIIAAAHFLEQEYAAPHLLVGHSLGGTAVLMAAGKLESIQAVATMGAPCDPAHVLQLLSENSLDEIRDKGEATVTLAGRKFKIKQQFVEDLEERGIEKVLEDMRKKAILVMHSPQDDTVEIENARHIYSAAFHPKSFISLNGADHLLTHKKDSEYAGAMIAQWAKRYLPEGEKRELQTEDQLVARIAEQKYLTQIKTGRHHLLADEPREAGGEDIGPGPYDFLSGGLAACTAMTLRMYADRKKWPLEEVDVHVNFDGKHSEDRENCENAEPKKGKFERILELRGDLDEKQQQRLLQIANRCPVHRTLEQGVTIVTRIKNN